MDKLYLVVIWDNVEPEIMGPYASEEERTAKAKELRQADVDCENGIYSMNIESEGPIEMGIGAYCGGDLEAVS